MMTRTIFFFLIGLSLVASALPVKSMRLPSVSELNPNYLIRDHGRKIRKNKKGLKTLEKKLGASIWEAQKPFPLIEHLPLWLSSTPRGRVLEKTTVDYDNKKKKMHVIKVFFAGKSMSEFESHPVPVFLTSLSPDITRFRIEYFPGKKSARYLEISLETEKRPFRVGFVALKGGWKLVKMDSAPFAKRSGRPSYRPNKKKQGRGKTSMPRR